jgi:hypothetical protein
MDRKEHYETAFEAFLRDRGIPYVAVDEAKRALFADAKLKSFDFVAYSRNGTNRLIDVKGRKCHTNSRNRSLQNWATMEDVDDLIQWEQVFGKEFKGLLVFLYWIDPPLAPEHGMFEHKDRWYWALAIDVGEYRAHMRQRSEKWKTVALATADFRQLARPIDDWL